DKAVTAPKNNIVHHKSFHANIIYRKYNDNSKQKIFSNRLGISYTTRYEAHNLDSILPPYKAIGPMYTKIYENFSRTLSSNPRIAARQNARFDRSCRRVFNNNKPKTGMALKL
ncbi:15677_t:CDS:1, partial [Rhizophagus irregularis]